MLTRYKKLIVTLMLLVYAGQSVASALMACTLHEGTGNAVSDAPAAQSVVASVHDHHGHHDDQLQQAPNSHEAHQHAAHAMNMPDAVDHAASPGGDAALQHHAVTSGNDAASHHAAAASPDHADDCCGAIGCAMGGCSLHAAMMSIAISPDAAQPVVIASPAFDQLQSAASFRFRPPIVA